MHFSGQFRFLFLAPLLSSNAVPSIGLLRVLSVIQAVNEDVELPAGLYTTDHNSLSRGSPDNFPSTF